MKFSIRAVCTQGQLTSSCSSKSFYNKSFFSQKLFFKKLPFFHSLKFWWRFQIFFFFSPLTLFLFHPLASEPPQKAFYSCSLSIIRLLTGRDLLNTKAGFPTEKKSFPKDLDSEWKSSELNLLNFLNHLQTFTNVLRGQVTCLYTFRVPPSYKSLCFLLLLKINHLISAAR